MLENSGATCVIPVARRNLAGAHERGKCRSCPCDTSLRVHHYAHARSTRTRISLRHARFAIACVFARSYIRASCSLFARARPRRAWVNERHGRRGYCVGFPHTGLLTKTSSLAAASVSRAAAPFASAAHHAACSPVLGESFFHRSIARIARARRAATTAHPLLLARPGRHALDESGGNACHRSTSRCAADVAVKNLRIIGSAVLLLNFREVRALHFCSTGVTM